MGKKRIGVVTSTRADYGVLKPLLKRLRESKEVEMVLVVTGSHLISDFGKTEMEIQEDGFKDYVRIPIAMEKDSNEAMAEASGQIQIQFARFFSQTPLDLLIVLGDRYEILAVVVTAFLIGIPIAHISGGDITEGAIDDAIRHAISKMSILHFAGCKSSAKRLVQMGECPERVFVVGELGVENCLNTELVARQELAKELDFSGVLQDYVLVTFHPETMENVSIRIQMEELMAAMDAFPNLSYLITMANADAGGREINQIWSLEAKKRTHWKVVTSLGVRRYLSAMRDACLVLGNSSSGIMEAPAMRVPTVNIGDRQRGREMAKSILSCKVQREEIRNAMKKGLDSEFRQQRENFCSPYGDGSTSVKILEQILLFLEQEDISTKKQFYNIDCNDDGVKNELFSSDSRQKRFQRGKR